MNHEGYRRICLAALAERNGATYTELAALCGLGRTQSKRHARRLLDGGGVEKIGPYYCLTAQAEAVSQRVADEKTASAEREAARRAASLEALVAKRNAEREARKSQPKPPRELSAQRLQILKMADSPRGTTAEDVAVHLPCELRAALRMVFRMRHAGQLFGVKGNSRQHFYFSTQQRADEFSQSLIAQPQAHTATKQHERVTLDKPVHRQKALTVVKEVSRPLAKPFESSEARITSKTRITVALTPPPRFHVDSAPSVINTQECRPWAVAAVESRGRA